MPAPSPVRRPRPVPAVPGRRRTKSASPAGDDVEEHLRHVQRLVMQGELAASAVHEISNLLTIVLFNAGLLRERHKSDVQDRKYIEPLLHSATLIATLCSQLRNLSRPAEPRTRVLDLIAAAQGTFRLLEQIMTRKLVFVAPDDGPVLIAADPAHIDQMLVNLVLNARDATRDESDRIVVRVGRGPGAGRFIEIEDEGTGMAPGVKRNLFKAFFTTKPGGQGTGLGMVTVQRLMQGMGGRIEVWSKAGRGTRVRLRFPAPARDEADPAPAPEPSLPAMVIQPG